MAGADDHQNHSFLSLIFTNHCAIDVTCDWCVDVIGAILLECVAAVECVTAVASLVKSGRNNIHSTDLWLTHSREFSCISNTVRIRRIQYEYDYEV